MVAKQVRISVMPQSVEHEIKHATSFRLSLKTRRLLVALAQQLGLSQASTIEMVIRKEARREGVTWPKEVP
jgi:hypothetical protein